MLHVNNSFVHARLELHNKMAKTDTTPKEEHTRPSQLYIAVDHLKNGIYQLNIMNNNTVVSTIKFKK